MITRHRRSNTTHKPNDPEWFSDQPLADRAPEVTHIQQHPTPHPEHPPGVAAGRVSNGQTFSAAFGQLTYTSLIATGIVTGLFLYAFHTITGICL